MRSGSHFASTIRRARALLGCSSAELARILEVSESTLARWEAGRQKPDLERQHDVVRRLRALTRVLLAGRSLPAWPLPSKDTVQLIVQIATDDVAQILRFLQRLRPDVHHGW